MSVHFNQSWAVEKSVVILIATLSKLICLSSPKLLRFYLFFPPFSSFTMMHLDVDFFIFILLRTHWVSWTYAFALSGKFLPISHLFHFLYSILFSPSGTLIKGILDLLALTTRVFFTSLSKFPSFVSLCCYISSDLSSTSFIIFSAEYSLLLRLSINFFTSFPFSHF